MFKQLIMHVNGTLAFVLSFKGLPCLLSNLQKERASPEVRNLTTESQTEAHPSQSINIIKPTLKCSSCFLHHFNGCVNTKPGMKSH